MWWRVLKRARMRNWSNRDMENVCEFGEHFPAVQRRKKSSCICRHMWMISWLGVLTISKIKQERNRKLLASKWGAACPLTSKNKILITFSAHLYNYLLGSSNILGGAAPRGGGGGSLGILLVPMRVSFLTISFLKVSTMSLRKRVVFQSNLQRFWEKGLFFQSNLQCFWEKLLFFSPTLRKKGYFWVVLHHLGVD